MSGYDEKFLGIRLPLPKINHERSGSVLYTDGLTDEGLADYPNYAVLTDLEHRAPLYVVALIDREKMKETKRTDRWKVDTRIGENFQLDNAYYANNAWDRGHLARRQSAGWGRTLREAQIASDETFYYSNASLQHANVNQDEWLGLEDCVHHLDIAKDGKIVVFAGPVYGSEPRTIKPAGREPAEIPAGFFKVVAFINSGKGKEKDAKKLEGELDVRAFLMFQDSAAIKDKNGREIYDYQHYQVTIREIEELTGLDFPDEIYERNPLFFHESESAKKKLKVTSFPERIDVNSERDLRGHGQERVPNRDDDVPVYIAAANVAPKQGDEEWVSILNVGVAEVDLAGWTLEDGARPPATLAGVLAPGEAKSFRASTGLRPVLLPNDGGVLVLLNDAGEHVDQVSYTKRDVSSAKDGSGKVQPIFFPAYRKA